MPVETALYDLLGVEPEATEGVSSITSGCGLALTRAERSVDEIKKAYRKKVSDIPILDH